MIKMSSNSAAELQRCVSEAEELASKPSLNRAEDRRYNLILSKISLLKSGFEPREISNIERERIMKDANLVNIPKALPDEVEKEWRSWIENKNQRHFERPVRFEIRELRAQAAGQQTIFGSSGAAGGFFVPLEYASRNLMALKSYDELFDNANEINTDTGALITIPSLDDVSSASQIISENSNPGPGPNFNAAVTALGAFSFRSLMTFVSLELLADSGVAIGGLLEACFAMRHARGVGAYMVNGTGVGQPTGLITAGIATGNVVVAAGDTLNNGVGGDTGANSIGTQDLNAIWGALNRAYRRESVWAMNDTTLIQLNGLLDKSGRPLVRYNNDLATIFNRPVIVCPSMNSIGPSQYSVALFAPRFYLQRRVPSGCYLRRSIEVTGGVEKGAVGFESYFRTDSNLCVPNPSFPPISLLIQHS